MFTRLAGVPVLMAAAVGIPYVVTNAPNIDKLFPSNSPQAQPSATAPKAELLANLPERRSRPELPQGPGETLYPVATPLEGVTAISLAEVFNFHVTKEWVYQRWSRKSTALSELGLFGIRVPLVTGTQLHDLAGSLTYFFGNDGRVHRIAFSGTTGDTTQLVMLLAQQYGLQPQSTAIAGEQLYQVRRQNAVFSELKTRPAPVLWSSSPHDSFAVDLQLQHPQITTPLPTPAPPATIANQAAPSQTSNTNTAQPANQQQTNQEAEAAKEQTEVDPREKWEVFFPRSRVPKQQVNSLDRRGQLW